MDCIYIALLSKALYSIASHSHPFVHRRRCQPCKVTTNTSGPVRVGWCLAQGHLDTWLGGARGSNQQPLCCQTIALSSWATATHPPHPTPYHRLWCQAPPPSVPPPPCIEEPPLQGCSSAAPTTSRSSTVWPMDPGPWTLEEHQSGNLFIWSACNNVERHRSRTHPQALEIEILATAPCRVFEYVVLFECVLLLLIWSVQCIILSRLLLFYYQDLSDLTCHLSLSHTPQVTTKRDS